MIKISQSVCKHSSKPLRAEAAKSPGHVFKTELLTNRDVSRFVFGCSSNTNPAFVCRRQNVHVPSGKNSHMSNKKELQSIENN